MAKGDIPVAGARQGDAIDRSRQSYRVAAPLGSPGKTAGVVELVDTQVLGTCDASRGGSSPSARTRFTSVDCSTAAHGQPFPEMIR